MKPESGNSQTPQNKGLRQPRNQLSDPPKARLISRWQFNLLYNPVSGCGAK